MIQEQSYNCKVIPYVQFSITYIHFLLGKALLRYFAYFYSTDNTEFLILPSVLKYPPLFDLSRFKSRRESVAQSHFPLLNNLLKIFAKMRKEDGNLRFQNTSVLEGQYGSNSPKTVSSNSPWTAREEICLRQEADQVVSMDLLANFQMEITFL